MKYSTTFTPMHPEIPAIRSAIADGWLALDQTAVNVHLEPGLGAGERGGWRRGSLQARTSCSSTTPAPDVQRYVTRSRWLGR